MDDIVERLRNAAEDEREWVEQQDVWHEELLDEAADEITALREKNEALERMVVTQAEETAKATKYWMARVKVLERGCLDLHTHVSGSSLDGDMCAKCGHDLRHPIHLGVDETAESVRQQALKGDKQS